MRACRKDTPSFVIYYYSLTIQERKMHVRASGNERTCIRQRTYVHQATNVRASGNERTCIDQRTYVHSKFLLPLEIIATSTKFEVQAGYTNIHLRIAYH